MDLDELVKNSLDSAEQIWEEIGHKIQKMAALSEGLAAGAERHLSRIPGYEFVIDGEPKVDEFIAVVIDLRNSTKHLLEAISHHTTKVSEMQRLFYETSALLPVSAKIIDFHGGRATEYIGDGVLGLFNVTKLGMPRAIYAAHDAASDCIHACKNIVSPTLHERYNLPPLNIGVGMGLSNAVITPVGYDGFRQPRAIGKCIYYATKLSKGAGEIWIDKALKLSWPKAAGGKLHFRLLNIGNIEGYMIDKKD
jgi:hypothetical protein